MFSQLNAIFAQNRLLKGGARNHNARRLSPEIGFHAIGAGPSTNLSIIGYEDVKSRFYGMGPTNAPDSLLDYTKPRSPADEGLLYGFEPCASLHVELTIAPKGPLKSLFLMVGREIWGKQPIVLCAISASKLCRR
jgi:cyclic beta-1,2-glucan synthetase